MPIYKIIRENRYYYIHVDGKTIPRVYLTEDEAKHRVLTLKEFARYKKIADMGLEGIKFKKHRDNECYTRGIFEVL